MQRANKTINTKVGLDLPMSERFRQRRVTINEEKTLVNTKGCTVPSLEMRRISCLAAIVATRNETEGSNFHVRNAMTTNQN